MIYSNLLSDLPYDLPVRGARLGVGEEGRLENRELGERGRTLRARCGDPIKSRSTVVNLRSRDWSRDLGDISAYGSDALAQLAVQYRKVSVGADRGRGGGVATSDSKHPLSRRLDRHEHRLAEEGVLVAEDGRGLGRRHRKFNDYEMPSLPRGRRHRSRQAVDGAHLFGRVPRAADAGGRAALAAAAVAGELP